MTNNIPDEQPPRPPRYAPPRFAPPQQSTPPPQPQPQSQPQQPVPPPHQWPPAHPQQQMPPQQQGFLPPRPGPGGLFDGASHPRDLQRPLYGASIAHAFTRFFLNYANFSGRASRSEFWWMALITWGAFIAVAVIAGALSEASTASGMSGPSDVVAGVFGLLFAAIFIGIIIPWLAIGWRRLHDANLAGSLYLLNLVPYIGGLVVFILTLLPPRPEGRRFDPPRRY